MYKDHLNLQQERDFGDVFNATFIFVKQNFKALFKALLIYVAPFALLSGIFMALGNYSVLSQAQMPNTGFTLGNYGLSMLFAYIFLMLAYVFLYAIILEYIKLYKTHGTNFPFSQLGKEVVKDLRKIIWTSIIITILIAISFVFLIVPAIYLSIVFSLILPIRILDNQPLGESMSRCFKLIKNNWWWTFLIVFIIGIIAYILAMVFGLPAITYQTIATMHSAQGSAMELNRPLMVFFYILSSLGSTFLQALPIIGITFQYFNLVEQKESPNLLKELETVGENEL